MAPLSCRRAFAGVLVLLIAGLGAGTAVAATTPATSMSTTVTGSATTPTTTAPATTTTTGDAPEPELARSVALAPGSGTVVVRQPGGDIAALNAAETLPTGTRVDTRRGEVVLTSAVDDAGTTQTGRFTGGIFEVRQTTRGYTQLVLVGGRWGACAARTATTTAIAAARRAVATKKKRKPIRRGGGSVATVRGTRWLTEDFCGGTRTTVAKGAVAVRSIRTGRTTLVRAGHSVFVPR